MDIQVRAIDDSLNMEDADKKDTIHVPIKSIELVVVDEVEIEDEAVELQAPLEQDKTKLEVNKSTVDLQPEL